MDNLENFNQLKKLAEKRNILFKQLCENCMASRIESGRNVKSLTLEELEKCDLIRKELEQIDKEMDELIKSKSKK